MIVRIFSNTVKHIGRSGWIGWASVIVMSLAFMVVSIFGGLAFVSNLYIQFIEQKSNMIVFFEVGMDQEIIDELEEKWSESPLIKEIDYISEEEAFSLYSKYAERAQPEIYAALDTQSEELLPSSLEIKLQSLDDLSEVERFVVADVEAALEDLKIYDLEEDVAEDGEEDVLGASTNAQQQDFRYKYSEDPTEPPIIVRVDVETLEELKEIMDKVRIGGLGILSLLLVVVCIFIFMISEFRLYNQKEEIGVMQLVGGSLGFIRSPYVLEGAFYGATGAFLSTGTIYGLMYWIFELNKESREVIFLYRYFASLDWPDFSIVHWSLLAVIIVAAGSILGGISSYLSIRRYIR